MNRTFRYAPLAALIALAQSGTALAYESGSTGADGAFNPTVNTQVQVPPNGVLNYTTMNVPSGVTVTFAKNATNTPVMILVGGDATIAGTINVSGSSGAATGAAGDGIVGDDGNPGIGGPGGFDGGQGGRVDDIVANRISQAGVGPGGAPPSNFEHGQSCGGRGGGFGANGGASTPNNTGVCLNSGSPTQFGTTYGSAELLPLVGGSGGSGGAGGTVMRGAGGGAGGGALLIAASGTLSVTGAIRANGGAGGIVAGAGVGGAGGGGSGGAIRLVATAIAGNGAISATGGAGQTSGVPHSFNAAGGGGAGRIRLEAETLTRTAASTPAHTFGTPGPAFVAGLPTLRISKVAGVDAPAVPTGNADIALPEETTNPVPVEVTTSGVPLGNTVSIAVRPAFGPSQSFLSDALAGTEAIATANASVNLPAGPSVLLATVSYSVPEALAMQSPYKDLSGADDLIERIAIEASPDGTMRRIATTRSGRQIDLTTVAALGG